MLFTENWPRYKYTYYAIIEITEFYSLITQEHLTGDLIHKYVTIL